MSKIKSPRSRSAVPAVRALCEIVFGGNGIFSKNIAFFFFCIRILVLSEI
ncbi:MAG: hypothetical protein K6B46_05575 [Opitutales bacterium]|nr:hypothetical protein [Opitutales bacterium]